MNNIKNKTLTGLLLSSPLLAPAEVLLLNGAYLHKAEDLPLGNPSSQIRLRRQYHSRSLHRGLLGFGWCSELEKELQITNQEIIFKDCLLSHQVSFKKLDQKVFVSFDRHARLVRQTDRYIYFSKQGEVIHFNLDGRLIEIQRNHHKVELEYNQQNLLHKLRFTATKKQAEIVTVDIDPLSKRVRKLLLPADQEISFLYHQDDLVEVKLNHQAIEDYAYDDFHNLTRAKTRSKEELMTYEQSQDLVTQLLDRQGCLINFSYQQITDRSQQTVVEKKCPKQPSQRMKVSFRLKQQRAQDSKPLIENSNLEDIQIEKNKRIRVYRLTSNSELLPRLDRRGALEKSKENE